MTLSISLADLSALENLYYSAITVEPGRDSDRADFTRLANAADAVRPIVEGLRRQLASLDAHVEAEGKLSADRDAVLEVFPDATVTKSFFGRFRIYDTMQRFDISNWCDTEAEAWANAAQNIEESPPVI